MDRRRFIKRSTMACLGLGLGAALGPGRAVAQEPDLDRVPTKLDPGFLRELPIIDAHAHPHRFYRSSPYPRCDTPTVDLLCRQSVTATGFAAVGDYVFLSNRASRSPFQDTLEQLNRATDLINNARLSPILRAADMALGPHLANHPGALLSIEGGDALEGKIGLVDTFHDLGVRMITLVHFTPNHIGDPSTSAPVSHGLTPFGRRVVERMNSRGMIIDVAHTDARTLRDIAKTTAAPVIDSHTHLLPPTDKSARPRRLRNLADLEVVARTGGVVCTWPLASWIGTTGSGRRTFTHWALEIKEVKKRVGMEHIGLGTDGGGGLPHLIRGYNNIADLSKLAEAMLRVGLTTEDIRAFMGGNLLRVFKQAMA